MRRLESIEDQMNKVVTYELADGRRVRLDQRFVQEFGLPQAMRAVGRGHLLPTERVVVLWCGRRVGTVPPDFDPAFIKSKSFMYDPRPGDFRRDGDVWVANPMLGPGDLESVPGFVWEG